MKIIVPMAGRGSRLRPHTLVTPKPLIPIAGKPIVQRLVEDIADMVEQPIDEVAFVIGDFGDAVEQELKEIAQKVGAKGTIHYQDKPLGTGHAIYCAKPALEGPVVVAFADTLFSAKMKLDANADGCIWTKQVDDPRQFGVVVTNEDGTITKLVEKPEKPVSDLAIIGIYYFKDGKNLAEEIKYILDNDIKDKGEYQLTTAMENMKEKGKSLKALTVDKWMDCGNKDVTVETNREVLKLINDEQLIAKDVKQENSVIIEPCYIAEGVALKNSVVGPYVSIGANTQIEGSVIDNSMVLEQSVIRNARYSNSFIGSHTVMEHRAKDYSIGDYTKVKE